MTNPAPERSLDTLMMGGDIRLEELVDREALGEMARSFYELFRVPLRIFDAQGLILADASEQQALYTYLNTFRGGREALSEVVDAVKNTNPPVDGEATHQCLTGAVYQITPISYDGRRIGRLILGPFLPPEVTEPRSAVLELDPEVDGARVKQLMAEMPRAREETVGRIAHHLKCTLDLILFSGHKALLTSNMHLAAVRESYRELQQKNSRLQEAFDRLKELDRLKSNFLATVSHELRTPLTSIIGYSEMLAEGIAGELAEEQADFVGTIREKGEQLLELIKGLLDLSKLESGTMSLRKANVDVAPIVEDVAQTLTPTARKKGVEIEVDIENGLPLLWADADRLRQVLLNLTENAIKFTPQGGRVALSLAHTLMDAADGEGEALVLLPNRRPAVQLRVADTGIGIPEPERRRVFDAFYQVDSSSTREQGGTGLGLSIVKRLVDGHDGTVRIEDNDPQGAVFVVTIPCRRATLS